MQTANIMLSLNAGNDVPKWGVTAAEIAVLIAIHGEDSVQDIEPIGSIERSNREELERLHRIYGRAKNNEDRAIVANLFPGAGARVFQTINELGLPEQFFKPTARAKAAPVVEEPEGDVTEAEAEPITPPPSKPDPLDHDGDGKKGGAKKPVKKADEKDADGVEDMPDGEKLFG